ELRRERHADAVAVLGVEDLQLATSVVDVQAAIGQAAVDIEEEGFDLPIPHEIPADSRSWRWMAPVSRPSPSTTKSEVILAVSIRSSALEANSSASTVFGSAWRQSPAVAERRFGSRSRSLLRSPSEITPRSLPDGSTTAVIPIIFRDISWIVS